MADRVLYKEMIDGEVVTVGRHKRPIFKSDLQKATLEEIKEAEESFKLNDDRCVNYHLVYDETGVIYHSRFCGICDEFISYI